MPLLLPHTIFARFSHDFEVTEMTIETELEQLTPAGRSQLDTYLDFLLSQESASAVKRKTAT